MITRGEVRLLQEKIPILEQALFFNLSKSVLRLPASVIRAQHVDELGRVWFTVTRPVQQLSEFEREFPARLNFYKKGENFYLHLRGRAGITVDPEDIAHVMSMRGRLYSGLHKHEILVKFTVTGLQYHSFLPLAHDGKKEHSRLLSYPSALFKTMQYIVKDVIPVFQSHRYPY